MAIYMTQFSYTPEAWAALVKNPEDRTTGLKALAEKLGGRVLNLYYSFGEYDGLVITEAPDETTATALILAAITPGHLKSTKTTVLMSVGQLMEALGKAGQQTYAGPKG